MRIENREDEQEHDIFMQKMKIEGDLQKEAIRVFALQQDLDKDNDGIPDPLEAARLQKELSEGSRKLDLEEAKIVQKDKEIDVRERIEREKVQVQREKKTKE